MKITLHGGTLEHIRDALDAVVEGDAPALVGVRWHTLEIGERDNVATVDRAPVLKLVSKDRDHYAKWDSRNAVWERYHYCDECGHEEWSEEPEFECAHGRILDARDDPDGWRE